MDELCAIQRQTGCSCYIRPAWIARMMAARCAGMKAQAPGTAEALVSVSLVQKGQTSFGPGRPHPQKHRRCGLLRPMRASKASCPTPPALALLAALDNSATGLPAC